MADKQQAEDDEDDIFGDFTFVSNTQSAIDDDWGDFVTTTCPTTTQNPNTNFDFEFPHPLGEFSQSNSSLEFSQSKASQNDLGNQTNSNSDSLCVWEKPKGAIPLSIFGDEEDEEEEESHEPQHPSNGGLHSLFPSKSLPTTIRSALSFNDIIVDLYGHHPSLNRSISLSNGDIDHIKVDNLLKLSVNQDLFGKGEQIKVENGSSLNPIHDFYGSKLFPFEDFYQKVEDNMLKNGSNLNVTQDLFGTKQQIKVENGSHWDLNAKTKQLGVVNGFSPNLIQENGDLDEDEWEFKDAGLEKSVKDGNFDVKKDDNVLASSEIQTVLPSHESIKTAMNGTPPKPNQRKIQESAQGSLFGFGNTSQLDGDWFLTPEENSYSPTVNDSGFDSESGVNTANIWNPESHSQPNIATENGTGTDLFNESFGSDESFGDFKDASLTEASIFSSKKKEELKMADRADDEINEQSVKDGFQGNGEVQENGHGALPLSIFSDGNVDADEQLFEQDMFSFKPSTSGRNGTKSQLSSSNLSLNDLIKDLYTRVETIPAVTSEHAENEFISPHTENEFILPQARINYNSADVEDDFDETSWEFKAAFTEIKDENLSSVDGLGYTHNKISSESRITSFADFYSRLKEKAGFIILHHLDDLKNAKKEAAFSGEDTKVEALHEEIQMAHKKLLDENMVPQDDYSKEHTPKNVSVNELLAAIEGPNFQVIDSEYRLSERISLAEQNLSSAIWLFEHAISVVKILNLGSVEAISHYTTTWSRMASVCARELKHGASILKQSIEKNVHKQMLSKLQGKRYILALGEIYRVAVVLRVSATFYKPWILSSLTKPMDIFAPLEESRLVWSNFGVNEAIQSLSDAVDIGYDGSIKTLLESIKSINDLIDLDVLSHQNKVSPPEETCRLSLLSLKMISGMKMVHWSGENYFLTLANFWANLISPYPPKLPQISVYS